MTKATLSCPNRVRARAAIMKTVNDGLVTKILARMMKRPPSGKNAEMPRTCRYRPPLLVILSPLARKKTFVKKYPIANYRPLLNHPRVRAKQPTFVKKQLDHWRTTAPSGSMRASAIVAVQCYPYYQNAVVVI